MIVIHDRWKACGHCGEVRPRRKRYFGMVRSPSGQRWDSWCRECRRAHQAEQRKQPGALARRRVRERARYQRIKDDQEFRRKQREASARWWARMPEERRVQIRQDARMRARLRRERDGRELAAIPIQSTACGAYRPAKNSDRLAIEPLLTVLPATFHGGGDPSLARALYRLRSGESKHTTLAVADAALCAIGRPDLLGVVYPHV